MHPFEPLENVNQSPPFAGRNLFSSDPVLRQAISLYAPDAASRLKRSGEDWGMSSSFDLGRLANENAPVLKTHDAVGNRSDQVEFHPAYHALMSRSAAGGLHSMPWENNRDLFSPAGHAERAGLLYLTAQVEAGHICPLSMTSASLAAIRHAPDLVEEWAPRLKTRSYDPSFRAPHLKTSATIGMGMTERQGGTDVSATRTVAVPDGAGAWRLTGHKWFMSAPMCDAFLILARTEKGVGLFLMPRVLPDETVNGLQFQRLKTKLGNRSNASSEVEFHDATAFLVGEEGRGIRTILDMVTQTRLDCATSSAGLMRLGLANAVHHVRHRHVFRKALVDQPIMQRVLGDMALDSAAATALVMRLSHSFTEAATNPSERAYARLMTPVIKYMICKMAPAFLFEAMECLGGNGYVEDGLLARAYREAPVNGIWEGAGNVMCLDLLRVLEEEPDCLDAVLPEFGRWLGRSGLDIASALQSAARACLVDPGSARILTEQLALIGSVSALRLIGYEELADVFFQTRLASGQWRMTYGMLDGRYDAARLIDTVAPQER
ncbi:acyl-CoA dehydrogenase family protein [Coralliovum pocilloporae]|uniref:acyl-CoA dehydrogenase family protein n=1 Tax=Coralliovum pocilloporae TaxID=3066369 RepID=UPI0033070DC5